MEWRNEAKRLYIEGKFCTDSDILDFADDNDVSRKVVDEFIRQLASENTRCQGCTSFGLGGMYPCNACSRGKEDHFSLSDEAKNAEWYKERCNTIKDWIDARVEANETTSCFFYITTPFTQYSCDIIEVPIIKKITAMLERNGIEKFGSDGPHWTFCDTISGAFNLNREWIEVGPIDCAVEFCGVYPVNWNIEDVVEFEMMEEAGQILVQVFWVDKDNKNFVPNH